MSADFQRGRHFHFHFHGKATFTQNRGPPPTAHQHPPASLRSRLIIIGAVVVVVAVFMRIALSEICVLTLNNYSLLIIRLCFAAHYISTYVFVAKRIKNIVYTSLECIETAIAYFNIDANSIYF